MLRQVRGFTRMARASNMASRLPIIAIIGSTGTGKSDVSVNQSLGLDMF